MSWPPSRATLGKAATRRPTSASTRVRDASSPTSPGVLWDRRLSDRSHRLWVNTSARNAPGEETLGEAGGDALDRVRATHQQAGEAPAQDDGLAPRRVGGLRPADRLSGLRRRLEALLGIPATEGNAVTVLRNGDRIFPAMLTAIRSATGHEYHLQDGALAAFIQVRACRLSWVVNTH